MKIALMQVELLIPDSHSLKNKRMVLRSIKAKIRNKFNVSIAEIDGHDLWNNTLLAIVLVGTDKKYVDQVLEEVIKYIEQFHQIELVDYMIEILA